MPRSVAITACLNGGRPPGSHLRLPVTTAGLVADAVAATAAGAAAVHLHVRDDDGAETLDPARVDETVRAVRRACPDVPISVSTGGGPADLDASQRAALVRTWSAPDAATVALWQPGYYDAMDAVLEAGVRLQVGVCVPGDVRRLLRTGMAEEVDRVIVQPGAGEVAVPDAVVLARAIERALDAAAVHAPRLHHGVGSQTWDVIGAAVARGRDIRIGLEDTLVGADGRPAASNAALVRMARRLVEA